MSTQQDIRFDIRERAAHNAYMMLLDAGAITSWRKHWNTGAQHGPDRPAIIAHRYYCPSCNAQGGEPCKLSPTMVEQTYSHVARHRVAQRELWQGMERQFAAITAKVGR